MPTIIYQHSAIEVDAPESILEGLENAGFSIPSSCRAGLCHSCMMQADTPPPPSSQQGLNDNQKAQHFFLSCCCIPQKDMTINLISDIGQLRGTVVAKKPLNQTVLALFIQVECRWFPGQYLTVWRNQAEGRSYSIASLCDEKSIIELHIKRHEYGLVSQWLHDEVTVGQTLLLSKPMGNCFYTDDHSDKPILMVATGTGLAPICGIVREALKRHHVSPIYLYAAAGELAYLYYDEELKALTKEYPSFHYIPVVKRGGPSLVKDDDVVKGDVVKGDVVKGDVVTIVQQRHQNLKGWKVFLCGNPDMVKQLQRSCFFQGVAVSDILMDAFVIEKH